MFSFFKSRLKYFLSVIFLALLALVYWRYNVINSACFVSHFTSVDAYQYYLPSYTYTARNLLSLRLPLWNPYQLCGVSYIGVLQGAIFYPPIVLFGVMSPATAYSVYLLFHLVLGGFFVVLLARYLELSWLASVAGAITFMFCSNTVSQLFGPASLANSIYLPLMFLFVLKIFETGRLRWAVALTLAVLFPLLAGWVQALVYSLYALGVFAAAIVIRSLMRKDSKTFHLRRGLMLLTFSAVLFLLLSAAQVLPVAELGRQGSRSFGKISTEMMTIKNTAMYGLDRIVFDSVNSNGGLLPFYFYVGLLPLCFSVVALFHKRLRFHVLFYFAVALCAVVLAMGPQTPLFGLWLHLPMTAMFRAPFRFLFLHALAVSLLGSIGLDYLFGKFASLKDGKNKVVMLGALCAAAGLLILISVWPVSESGQTQLMKTIVAASRWPVYMLGLTLVVFFSAAVSQFRNLSHYVLGLGCLFIITADLFTANHNYFYLPEKNPEIYEQHNQVVETLKSLTDVDHSRVFVASNLLDFSYCLKLGELDKLELIDDYENMNPMRYNRYCNYLFGRNDEKSREFFWGWFNLDDTIVHPDLLNYMSAKYIWVSRDYIQQGTENVSSNYSMISKSCIPIYSDARDMVFLNPRALPRAYVVGKIRVVSDEEEALRLLTSDKFSPREEVVLSESPEEREIDSGASTSGKSSAMVNSVEPERISITTESNGRGFLVLTDQYYPGWEAFVDGSPRKIYRANYLFRCVAVPPGRHEVVFQYAPRSFRLGIMLSSVGLLALIACAIWPLTVRPRKTFTETIR